MASYIGNAPVPQATQTRDRFVATAAQTSFATSGYDVGFLDVYLNGVKLDSTDYTATNGSDVVLSSGAASGDILEVVAFSTFQIGSNVDNASVATQSLVVDRQSTDGTIIDLQKDGTTVGSIGTLTGWPYFSRSSHNVGLALGGADIFPVGTAGSANDNAISLGSGTARWKDLYLSGGVYLGGTGSANYLDDYEEGTWTPSLIGSTVAGTANFSIGDCTYTKIGNLVHVRGGITWNSHTGSGSMLMTNLPFTVSTAQPYSQGSVLSKTFTYSGSTVHILANSGTTKSSFYGSGSGIGATPVSIQASGTVEFSMTYLV